MNVVEWCGKNCPDAAKCLICWRPRRDLNPCYRRERKWRKDSRRICKARVAHQGPVRTVKNGTQCTASVPRVLNQDSNEELDDLGDQAQT
jgi:hypothetical protein